VLTGSEADGGPTVFRADIISIVPKLTKENMAKNDTLAKIIITSF
jgi:hypothetical protein